HHLACDTMLDMPKGPPSGQMVETGALAMATRIVEEDDPQAAAYWGAPSAGIAYPRFVAIEPRHAAAAQMINEAVDGYLDKLRARSKAEAWRNVRADCRAFTSTNRLVSVLCNGGGNTDDGSSRVARGSITVRLGDPPERVTGAELFAHKPGAPKEIVKRCLGWM